MLFCTMHAPSHSLTPKDFIETPEGLLFAVLSGVEESGRIPAYLRYRRTPQGLQKVATQDAFGLLISYGNRFYFDSETRAIRLQGVALEDIHRIFRAKERVGQILSQEPGDPVTRAAQKLLRYLLDGATSPETLGVTGSLLIGAQGAQSDIDLVIYARNAFDRIRNRVLEGITTGIFEDLSAKDWAEAHARRGASLTLKEYLWHEQRKGNKALINGVKFDLTLLDAAQKEPEPAKSKSGARDFRAMVTDASEAFGFPARYRVNHPEIFEVLAFSQTYAGQAIAGERIWVRGRLEDLYCGRKRMVVGQDREALGEFIKVEMEDGQ
jgi:predicted nucleotidyltransferase